MFVMSKNYSYDITQKYRPDKTDQCHGSSQEPFLEQPCHVPNVGGCTENNSFASPNLNRNIYVLNRKKC
jgi:hypothetical protein